MTDYVEADFLVQFLPAFDSNDNLAGAFAGRLNQIQPRKPVAGAVPIWLRVRIPKAAFEPLRAQPITVELPDERRPIVGTAGVD